MATKDFYAKSPANPTGFVVVNKAGKAGVLIFLHGTGGWSDGSLDTWGLPSLFTRENELPETYIDAAVKNDFVLIAPQIQKDTQWQVADINNVLDHQAMKDYDKNKIHLQGFSLGGGGVVRYATSSKENADRIATAAIFSGINSASNWQNAVDSKLPMWFFANDNDTRVPVSNTHGMVAKILTLNPEVKPLKTIYKSGGHAYGMVVVNAPPATPETADGFNDPKFSIYEWMKLNPRGGVVTSPPEQNSIIKVVTTVHYKNGSTKETVIV